MYLDYRPTKLNWFLKKNIPGWNSSRSFEAYAIVCLQWVQHWSGGSFERDNVGVYSSSRPTDGCGHYCQSICTEIWGVEGLRLAGASEGFLGGGGDQVE